MRAVLTPPQFEILKPKATCSPDEWAELSVQRIMMVSDSAPEPLRSQAYGYREQIRQVIAKTIKQAIEADRVARSIDIER